MGLLLVVGLCLAASPRAGGAPQQTSFGSEAMAARLPATRVESYVVNARVRPLLLFWIERENVGLATISWRKGEDNRRAFEFLIGSDPERAPRSINRWGFIVEELNGDAADVFGIMKESGEQTLAEAEAKVSGEGTVSTFKAARTSIAGSKAVTGLITLQAPSHLTYRDVDAMLALVPAEAPEHKTIELPAGTEKGFLVAMDSLMGASIGPCGGTGRGAKAVPAVRYLYNQTFFDLALDSCRHEDVVRAGPASYADVVDGRFRLKNLTTKNVTTFHIAYGASGDLRGVPVRAMFRPRWWMEIDLALVRTPAARLTSTEPLGR